MTRLTLQRLALIVLSIAVGTGCKSSPRIGSYDIGVDGASLGGSTANVHLVGVTDDEKSSWLAIDPREYWTEGNTMRRKGELGGYTHEMTFGSRSNPVQTLSRTAPIWQSWKSRHARWLIVMGDLPGGPYREVLPLHQNRWTGIPQIKVRLQRGFIEVLTVPLPEE